MSTNRDFDRIAKAWLAEGPNELADRVLDDALAEVQLTNQRRGLFAPWRYAPMNAFSRAAAAVVVAALVLGGAVYLLGRNNPSVGGPGATPTVSPSPAIAGPSPTELPASALVPFTSAQYGYTISVIKGWGAQVATRTLHGTEPLYGNDPQIFTPAGDSIMGGLDAIQSGPSGRLLIAGSAMPAGTTLASWTAETTVAKCGAPTSQAAITVDGEAATLTTYAGAQACFGLSQQWATVIHGGWAWDIVWIDNQGSESADAFFFEQILGTFRFGEVPASSPAPS
jgi:hypothetical protein